MAVVAMVNLQQKHKNKTADDANFVDQKSSSSTKLPEIHLEQYLVVLTWVHILSMVPQPYIYGKSERCYPL